MSQKNKILNLALLLLFIFNNSHAQNVWLRLKFDGFEEDFNGITLKVIDLKIYEGKGFQVIEAIALPCSDTIIAFTIPEPTRAEIKLFKNDSVLSYCPTFILSKDTFDVSFAYGARSAYVMGGENDYYYNNQILPFELPAIIVNDKGFRQRIAHERYAISFPDNLMLQFKYKEYERNVLNLVRQMPGNYYLVTKLLDEANNISFETLDTAMRIMDSSVLHTIAGKRLQAFVANGKWLLHKPDLSNVFVQDASGKRSSIQAVMDTSRFTFVDFWASWCVPCRAFNKELSDRLDSIDASKLGIVSISIDEDEARWQKAVVADKIIWQNYLDPSKAGFSGVLAALFGIQFIPQSFLFDKEGKIVELNVPMERLLQLGGR